ncbi:MAG: caspase family protein [Flammeovirgaceae bacterium]|nr:caspase family protein [Flammeovirgaceae bacterium]
MKTKLDLAIVLALMTVSSAVAQNVSTRTNDFEVDFSDPTKLVSSTIPVINWITPVGEINYAQESKYKIKFEIESSTPIKNITISIKESESEGEVRGSQSLEPKPGEELYSSIEKNLNLMDGQNVLEIVAENIDGVKTVSYRTVHVGESTLANASNLSRTDYAIIFVTDDYDYWNDLVNPVFDGTTIGNELKETYGFQVEVIKNATQAQVLKKVREYAEKKYEPLDQLLIFFAGHGQFDQTFGEGYVVTKESLLHDEAKTSYLSHNRLRSIVNNIPCDHIFLAMDVCFGGTFDQGLASSRGLDDETYKEASQADIVKRLLKYKTRKYLTSGGKEYVSDGIKGSHSPFARKFIEALRSRGGKDRILTLGELGGYLVSLKTLPTSGEFGDNAPGSDFVFVAK